MTHTTYHQGTYCQQVDHVFADTAARAIAQAVSSLHPVRITLQGYTPPYEIGDFPQGYIELNFSCHKDAPYKSIGFRGAHQGSTPLHPRASARGWSTRKLNCRSVAIGIIFGQTDDQGQPYRESFEPEIWATDPENQFSAPITAINFDEAWRIVAKVIELTNLRRVSVVYGC